MKGGVFQQNLQDLLERVRSKRDAEIFALGGGGMDCRKAEAKQEKPHPEFWDQANPIGKEGRDSSPGNKSR